jgi:hypothetical protein
MAYEQVPRYIQNLVQNEVNFGWNAEQLGMLGSHRTDLMHPVTHEFGHPMSHQVQNPVRHELTSICWFQMLIISWQFDIEFIRKMAVGWFEIFSSKVDSG